MSRSTVFRGFPEAWRNPARGVVAISRAELVLLVLSGLAGLAFVAVASRRVVDDAFITYRFAQNLADGHGPVWNPGGVPTEGFTSPLHVLLCAAGLRLGLDPLLLTRVAGLAAVVFSAMLSRVWLERIGGLPGWLRAAPWVLLLANGCLVYSAVFGLETTLVMLIITAAAYAWWCWQAAGERSAVWLFAAAGFLAVVGRPDTVLWLGVLLGVHGFQVVRARGTRPGLSGLPALAVLVAAIALFMVVKYVYFGYRLPNAYYVKEGEGLLAPAGVRYVAQFMLWAAPVLAGVVASLCLVGSRALTALALASLAFVLAFVRFKPLMGTGFRFLQPVWPVLVVCGVVGAVHAWAWLQQRWPGLRVPPWRPRLVRGGLVLGLLWLAAWQATSVRHILRSQRDHSAADWERIGRELRWAAIRPMPTIAMGDQGALPYFSGWNALDLVGLTTNEVAQARSGAEVAEFILRQQPEVLVLRRRREPDDHRLFIVHARFSDLAARIFHDPRFQGRYREVGWIPDPDLQPMVWYVDQSAPTAAEITAALQRGFAHIPGAEW